MKKNSAVVNYLLHASANPPKHTYLISSNSSYPYSYISAYPKANGTGHIIVHNNGALEYGRTPV